MKKIFTLAIIMLAMTNIALAQEYDMIIEETDGTLVRNRVENITKMTYVEREDPNAGWTSLGYCLYGEDFLASQFKENTDGDLCCKYYVEVQEKDDQPGLYRLVNPYSPYVYPFSYLIDYDINNEYYIEINACDPDGVYIDYQNVGVTVWGYCNYYVYSMAAYYLDVGYSFDTVKESGYMGTLSDGKITFPTGALFCYMPEYDPYYYYYANLYGNFCVDLNDKSDSLGQKGAKKADDKASEPNYDLCIEKVDGSTSKYKVEYIAEMTHEERADENIGWTSLGYCLYGEDFLGSTLYESRDGDLCCEYYVEVQQNYETPGIYRLVNPYSPDVYPLASTQDLYSYDIDNNYYIEINCTDPDGVYVEYQDTGMSWGDFFGRFYVYCMGLWCYEVYGGFTWDDVKEAGYLGTLKDGVISFPENTLATQFLSYGTGFFLANTHNNFKVDTNETSNNSGVKGAKPTSQKSVSINLNNLLTAEEVAKLK